jgi:hypothetical protein
MLHLQKQKTPLFTLVSFIYFIRSTKNKLDFGTVSTVYKDYQLLAHGQWFSPGTPASSTTRTGRHDIHCSWNIVESGAKTPKINQSIWNHWAKWNQTWYVEWKIKYITPSKQFQNQFIFCWSTKIDKRNKSEKRCFLFLWVEHLFFNQSC